MPNTFELIAASTVGVLGSNTISFTSIPSTFDDLCLKFSLRSTFTAGSGAEVTFNGSTSGYSYRQLYGFSGGTGSVNSTSTTSANFNIPGSNATASTFGNTEMYIPNYTSSTAKSLSIDEVYESNSTTLWQLDLFAYLWSGTAAINSITITEGAAAGIFAEFSTVYLYGVKKS
jgi:hypothetical protein